MPDNIQKYPYRPFPHPVPPIPLLNEGQMCITFDRKYLKYIIGSLKSLEAPQTYESDQQQSVMEARELIKIFIVHDDDCENTCIEFPTSSGIIGYAPKNPFTESGEIPDGYIAPPFYVLADDAVTTTLGLQEGDVISGWFSLPVLTPALNEGLARFRVNVEGPCTVELHLLTIPSGGVAWIVDDDNILTLTSADLNRDLVALPPETSAVVIQERTFTTDGAHHIDVSFLAQFNDSAVFLGYGGGVRKVVVCGGDDLMLDVRQNPDENCILEKRSGAGEWVQFADLSLCGQKPTQWRSSGGHTQYSHDGTTWYEYPDGVAEQFGQREPDFPMGVDKACIAARSIVSVLRGNYNQLRDALAEGAAIFALMALISAFVLVFVTVGAAIPLVLALVAEIYAIGSAGITNNLTDSLWDNIECLIYERIGEDGLLSTDEFASFRDAVLSLGDAGTILSLLIDIYGPVGLNNMVTSAGITTCDTEPCDDTLIREFNFLESPCGWLPCLRDFQEVGNPITQGGQFIVPSSEWRVNIGWTQQATRYVSSNTWFWLSSIRLVPTHELHLTKIDIETFFQHGTVTISNGQIHSIAVYNADRSQAVSVGVGPNYTGASDGIITASAVFGGSGIVVPVGGEIKMKLYISADMNYAPPYLGYGIWRKIKFYGSQV